MIHQSVKAFVLCTVCAFGSATSVSAAPANEHDCAVFQQHANNSYDTYQEVAPMSLESLDDFARTEVHGFDNPDVNDWIEAVRVVNYFASNTARFLEVPSNKKAAQELAKQSDVLFSAVMYNLGHPNNAVPQRLLNQGVSRYQAATTQYQKAIDQACAE